MNVLTFVLCAAAYGAGGPAKAPPGTTRPGTRPLPNSPAAKVVERLYDHLRAGRRDAASALVATPASPVRHTEQRLKRLGTALASGNWDFVVLDAKESGNAAVVIINEHLKDGRQTIDVKPWYLVKQGGDWKLLAKYTDFELKEYGFDVATLARFGELEEWARRREPDLRRELPDCGC